MAAGLGFKNFTSGEVLTAADVNGYLMQGILVFANATARDAAITSPQEGQFAYLKDTNVTTYYTGSAWANVDTTGMTNPMTTTGDTIYSSSGSTPARLAIGTAGQILKVNSGATAPEWATLASSGPTNDNTTVSTYQGTTSTSYTALATAGPAVTITTGTKALVILSSFIDARGSVSFDISGSSSFSAADTKAVQLNGDSISGIFSGVYLMTGLTAGSNTFTQKYRSTNGAATNFQNRNLAVIDMGS
jgi:hypothetical protein